MTSTGHAGGDAKPVYTQCALEMREGSRSGFDEELDQEHLLRERIDFKRQRAALATLGHHATCTAGSKHWNTV